MKAAISLIFWGIGFDVTERMGLIPELRKCGYRNDQVVFVSRSGKERNCFGGKELRRWLGNRFLSIQRDDMAQTIFEAIRKRTEVIFGDEIHILDTARFRNGAIQIRGCSKIRFPCGC